jgi:hypothetical protein
MTASDTSIHKGDLVKFKVTVTANKAKCIKNDTIHLLKNGSQVATGTTNDQGKVVFNRHPKKTAKWQAVFKGKKTGKHPNRLNCLGSASGTIKVVVKK